MFIHTWPDLMLRLHFDIRASTAEENLQHFTYVYVFEYFGQ